MNESMDRKQKRRPTLHRVEKRSIMQWKEDKTNVAKGGSKGCNMQKEDKQLFIKEITNDTIISIT